jgi:hypothetical protein
MAVYEVTRAYLGKFVDDQIEKNPKLKDYRDELLDILCSNTSNQDFMANDLDNDDKWPFEDKEPTQLYVRDSKYHIRIKDVAVDFFEMVFSGALFDSVYIMFSGCKNEQIATFEITKDIIWFISRLIREYVVKLDNTEFCIYLQVITHFSEHREFTVSDLIGWLPTCGTECNMHTDKWVCSRFENGMCYFQEDSIEQVLERMVKKNIFEYSDDNTYKVRY